MRDHGGNLEKDSTWFTGTCTLDHDGCVVCSDAGIPVRVVEVEGEDAICEDVAGNRSLIAVELVHPVQLGEVLLTHGGVAIGRGGTMESVNADWEGNHEVCK